jgi:hypothetical protein
MHTRSNVSGDVDVDVFGASGMPVWMRGSVVDCGHGIMWASPLTFELAGSSHIRMRVDGMSSLKY